MKKIVVIGCPGSGKSTFSRALHEKTGIPLYHLDMMFWNDDKTTVGKSVFLERLSSVMEKDEWIIDGNYLSTMQLRISVCDTVMFLDYPVEICLDGVKSRRGMPRTDMPWVETEEDAEFIEFIKKFNDEQKTHIMEILNENKDKQIIVLSCREQRNKFLERIL